jgi:hypothetical protein
LAARIGRDCGGQNMAGKLFLSLLVWYNGSSKDRQKMLGQKHLNNSEKQSKIRLKISRKDGDYHG